MKRRKTTNAPLGWTHLLGKWIQENKTRASNALSFNVRQELALSGPQNKLSDIRSLCNAHNYNAEPTNHTPFSRIMFIMTYNRIKSHTYTVCSGLFVMSPIPSIGLRKVGSPNTMRRKNVTDEKKCRSFSKLRTRNSTFSLL